MPKLSKVVLVHHVCNLTQNFVSIFEVLFHCMHNFESAFLFFSTLVNILIILQCPKAKKTKNWNLNNLTAHNFLKLT